ncbi:MAG: hypothetical protein AB1734_08845 [Elusimicrobiota bacterium]
MMRDTGYEILQYSLCDGWVNNLLDGGGKPCVFATLREAVAELQGEFDDWTAEIESGERDADDGYNIGAFQIKCAATGVLHSLDLVERRVALISG